MLRLQPAQDDERDCSSLQRVRLSVDLDIVDVLILVSICLSLCGIDITAD